MTLLYPCEHPGCTAIAQRELRAGKKSAFCCMAHFPELKRALLAAHVKLQVIELNIESQEVGK
jgi:hypothetical protein